MTWITETGVYSPKTHILDNESSYEFKIVIKKQSKLQLVPPDTHQRNIAEREIQTFKNHLIAIMLVVDSKLPMHLWCILIPQKFLTLNLVIPSHDVPKMSARACLHGYFDYNGMPLSPLEYPVQLYVKPHRRN